MTSLGLVTDPRGSGSVEGPLTVGDAIPDFRLPALAVSVGNGWEFDSAWLRGRWVALLYWPKQSCLESATDVAELASMGSAFSDRETQFVAVSAALAPQRRDALAQSRLSSEMPFPVLVDVRGDLAAALGIDVTGARRAVRATFVADPSGVIRWMSASDLSAVRSLHEAAQALNTARGGPPPAGVASFTPVPSFAPLPSFAPAVAAAPRGGDPRLIRACAWCSRLQDEGEWLAPEDFIRRRTRAEVSHGICCECLRTQMPR